MKLQTHPLRLSQCPPGGGAAKLPARHSLAPAARHSRRRQPHRTCAVARSPSPQPRRRAEAATELAAASTSCGSSDAEDQTAASASRDDAGVGVNGSLGASLTASMDDAAYRQGPDSTQDGKPQQSALMAAWQQSPIVKGWEAYTRALELNPVRTKAITSFFGFVLGDICAQKIGGVTAVDPLRCVRLGAYGLFLDGPFGHLWYKVLDKNVCPDNPSSLKAVLLKTAADQLIWAPIMTCVFFAVLKTLEGHPELILGTIQDKLIKTIVANYILWPGAHFINFRFVPSQHRILYNNCVSVVWNAYLSTLSHDAATVDTTQLLSVLDQAQGLLNGWVPPELADTLSTAFGGGHGGLEGLRFDIPKSIDLKPTRTLLDFLPLLSEEKGI